MQRQFVFVGQALRLCGLLVKPENGVLYGLQREDHVAECSRAPAVGSGGKLDYSSYRGAAIPTHQRKEQVGDPYQWLAWRIGCDGGKGGAIERLACSIDHLEAVVAIGIDFREQSPVDSAQSLTCGMQESCPR